MSVRLELGTESPVPSLLGIIPLTSPRRLSCGRDHKVETEQGLVPRMTSVDRTDVFRRSKSRHLTSSIVVDRVSQHTPKLFDYIHFLSRIKGLIGIVRE